MAPETHLSAWALTAISGEKQWGGNTGYEDDPTRLYRYDSQVANHKRMKVGDIVVIRDRHEVLGYSKISRISVKNGEKELRRCPTCGTAAIKRRRNARPTWRCKNAHEFENPELGQKEVTLFEASYGENYLSMSGYLSVQQLKGLALRPNDQLSIEELDLPALEQLLTELFDEVELFVDAAFTEAVPSASELYKDSASIIQERRTVMRSIALRRGQAAFRKRLLDAYSATCVISRCRVVDILEAAHIVPYSRSRDNGIGNGLLLRSDLHTLFDLGKLAIEPKGLRARILPELIGTEYERYDGLPLFDDFGSRPSRMSLEWRWRHFRATRSSSDVA